MLTEPNLCRFQISRVLGQEIQVGRRMEKRLRLLPGRRASRRVRASAEYILSTFPNAFRENLLLTFSRLRCPVGRTMANGFTLCRVELTARRFTAAPQAGATLNCLRLCLRQSRVCIRLSRLMVRRSISRDPKATPYYTQSL